MSVPARNLPVPRLDPQDPVPDRAARPARTPAVRPAHSTPPQRRAHRGSPRPRRTAFWVFTAVLMTTLVMTVVSLNALVVNATYRLQTIQGEQGALIEEGAALRIEVAKLSSPSRIAQWAEDNGMRTPASDEVIPLRVAGSGGGSA